MPAWEPDVRIGPYALLSLAGVGGMGEVWKARDTRLGRLVAIKRTTREHSERFEQEARAVAALNHPHICQLYDIGPDYLVLEYITGQPLAGPLPPARAVEIAVQVVSALEEAHRGGMIHRDLKPSNIMITEHGAAKLLDFGLAVTVVTGDSDLTRAVEHGALVGTPAYMAPEQAEGRALDARSDIFSFGAVLYEMLSGRRAFSGDSIAGVLSAILRDDPPPLDAPPAVERIVRRCLAKPPGERFQSAADLRAALLEARLDRADVEAPDRTEQVPSVAVLPFLNMSADKDNEYFSDGLAEDILNVLAHVPGLKVTARASSFAFRGKEQDIGKIARSLNVKYILEGSVRRAGARIRVTSQLINPVDGNQLWSERYDRELADVFAVQDEIATAIAGALQVKLSRAPAANRAHIPTVPAHEAFLKGRYHLMKITPESLARGKEYFEQALALDPGFALAHSYLAWYYFLQSFHGLRPSREVIPLSRSAARKALELDAALPQARSMLASIAGLYDYDWAEAKRLFELALSGAPVPGEVRWAYGNSYLLPFGRADEATQELLGALDHDPLNVVYRNARGIFLYVAGKHDAAVREARGALEIDDRYWGAHFSLGMNYASRGMVHEALGAAERAYELAPWTPCTAGLLAGALARAGNTDRAGQLVEQLRQAPGQPHWGMMLYHLIDLDVEAATDWLVKGIEQRDLMTIIQIRAPLTAPLRSTPRWPAIARELNLPPASEPIVRPDTRH